MEIIFKCKPKEMADFINKLSQPKEVAVEKISHQIQGALEANLQSFDS